MTEPAAPLLAPAEVDQLRQALQDYTVDAVHELLGLAGRAAHSRGDLSGVARALRHAGGSAERRTRTLVELFLLGLEVDAADAAVALHPLPLDAAIAAGLLATSAGSARALLELRPYAEDAGTPLAPPAPGPDWWVVSDLGADVRPGPLHPEHVLGIGAASLTLARATPRAPVGRALDIGTGCGVQALHLAGHAAAVTATDVSHRALRFAATTAALSGQRWDLRAGSLLTPVSGETYDLVVANPPFVVSAGTGSGRTGGHYDYRDSGLPGDQLCESLVSGLPQILAPGGTAVLLANWIIPADESWQQRVERWITGRGCDAWLWQREVAEPGEYISMWLRDAGEQPGTARWAQRYEAWADWFAHAGVAGVGMGLVALWRPAEGELTDRVVVAEDVPQAVSQPAGPQLPAWIARRRWLAVTSDADLLGARLHAADGLVRTTDDLMTEQGWRTAAARLRQSHGMRWEVEVDVEIASLVAACDGATPLRTPVALLSAALGRATDDVAAAVVPVVRDLVGRGFLLPPGAGSGGEPGSGQEPGSGGKPGPPGKRW